MNIEEKFKKEITVFLAKNDMAPSLFGRLACNDSKFWWGLFERSRSPTLKKVEQIRSFMRTYRNKKRS